MKLLQRKWSKKVVLVIIYFTCLILVSLLFALSQCRYKQPGVTSKEFFSEPSNSTSILSKGQNIPLNCETIHLAIVCGGFNSTRNLYVLFKSILFYRSDNIQLHLFVDNISHVILKELFHTWIVQDLEVNFYNLTEHEQEVSWIMSEHYSHRYGLMKLDILSTLGNSEQLTKVILIDTDMLVLGNIRRVWEEFDNLINSQTEAGEKPIFGLVENQSDWYLGDSRLSGGKNVWPAIGRGFNSGLILVNLVELRRINWRQVWNQVAESELILRLSTSLADQDILNAVLRLHPYMLHRLPCTFNIQLNDHTKLEEVCPAQNEFRIIHWNSPYKFLTKNPKAHYYTNTYLNFRNWDAKLLEQGFCRQQLTSGKVVEAPTTSLGLVCREIQPQPNVKVRTFLYFLDFEWEATKYDVTLVVHLSLDRLQVLDELALNWVGPISVAIYLSELETNLFLMSIENSENLAKRKNIGYHLVFRDHGFNYPINRLRNIALGNVLTDYVFLTDIDFLPSANLYDYLKQTLADMSSGGSSMRKRALVIAAFENLQYKFDFPTSKAELLTQLNLGSVSMFRDQLWPRGHAPTNYAKWRTSTKPYQVDWQPDYEPFIVTGKEVIRFDERFVGFGWNKVEHIMQLAALDYEFFVLPEAFLIHKLHSASYDIMKHRQSFTYRNCIKQLKKTFLVELRIKFPDFFSRISATNQTFHKYNK